MQGNSEIEKKVITGRLCQCMVRKKRGSDTDLDEAMIEYFISYFSRFLFYSEDFHNFFLSLFFFFRSTTFTPGIYQMPKFFHSRSLGRMWKMGLRQIPDSHRLESLIRSLFNTMERLRECHQLHPLTVLQVHIHN